MAKSIAWGYLTATEDTKESWSVWKTELGNAPVVIGDPDYGKVAMYYPVAMVSDIIDMTHARMKKITIDYNKYGYDLQSCNVAIRGSADIFYNEELTPAWEVYTGTIKRAWRYFQIKVRPFNTSLSTTTSTTTSSSTSSFSSTSSSSTSSSTSSTSTTFSTFSTTSTSSTFSTTSSSTTTTIPFDGKIADLTFGWSTTTTTTTTTVP